MGQASDQDAYRQWLEWHRHMVRAIRDQGSTRYTIADYERRFPLGDGVPRTAGGHPYQPLDWK